MQIHEASHNLLFRSKKLNDLYCNVVLAAWALQDVHTYRSTHGMHHTHLHGDQDPDRWLYESDGGRPKGFWRTIAEDLLLLAAFTRKAQVKRFMAEHDLPGHSVPIVGASLKIAAQLAVVGVLVATCGPWGVVYYGGYLYGLLGVFPLLVRVRTTVQHRRGDPRASGLAETAFTARSTRARLGEFILIGARMDYHFEHHLFPTIPYYGLKTMHTDLRSKGFFDPKQRGPIAGLSTDNYLAAFANLART